MNKVAKLTAILLCVGAGLAVSSAGSRVDASRYRLSADSISSSANLPQGDSDQSKAAMDLFVKHCATCHGKDGRAKTLHGKMAGARNFTDEKWQGSVTDDQLIESITNGKHHMPAFGKKLSADQIKSLVTVVRGFKPPPSK